MSDKWIGLGRNLFTAYCGTYLGRRTGAVVLGPAHLLLRLVFQPAWNPVFVFSGAFFLVFCWFTVSAIFSFAFSFSDFCWFFYFSQLVF
jgi:hypothetical protein